MNKIAITILACLAMSGCVASTALQTGRLPTAAEAQAQLQADLLALKIAGCITADVGAATAPLISANVDANGQRIAATVDQISGKVCSIPAATVPAAP